MSNDIDAADQADPMGSAAAPEELQQHPTEGGSYIRYPDTGKIEKLAGPTDAQQE